MRQSGTSISVASCSPISENSARPRSRRWFGAALLLILILAGWLRFAGIMQVGVLWEDEGWYAADARLWHRCARVLTDTEAIQAVWGGDKQVFGQRMADLGVDFAWRYQKPSQGFTFLGAMMMFVVGDRPAALLVVNALLGTLTVLVLYGLGVLLFDRTVALCAALVLAVSPYHLTYCRSAMTQTSAGFFILLGVWLWAWGRTRGWSVRRTYVLSGIALGYAIACHYTNAFVPVVLAATDLFVRREDTADHRPDRLPSLAMRRWWWLGVGAALPIIAFEGVFRAARLAASVTDSYLPVHTYLEGAWRWAMVVSGGIAVEGGMFNWEVVPAFVGLFVGWHGVVAGILVVVGLVAAAHGRRMASIAAAMVVGTLVLLLLQRHLVARGFSAAVPFACLCIAIGVCAIVTAFTARRWRKAGPVAAVALAAIVCTPALARSVRLMSKKSDVIPACRFVRDQGGGVVAATNRIKFCLYLEGSGVPVVDANSVGTAGSPADMVEKLKHGGVRWMIVEPRTWLHATDEPWCRWWEGVNDYVARTAQLAAQFPHVSTHRWEFLAEGARFDRLDEMRLGGGGTLRIYDLRAPAVGAEAAPQMPVSLRQVAGAIE